ncbi:MAG: ABC transporter permease [Paracoccaceae bacterium]|nr:ABC transporter permease [Marinovum sp.]MBT6099664.1 ABC transporter permease [Marinovum sp.]MBT6507986.1 ABC transporter permease [Marinovum sp.]MBT7907138.1 ABC transporter permease [Marinovum sp.]MDG1424342.1 ABC transporter permease [Paracoccaceae bacterium]
MGTRRFGRVNWLGLMTLTSREVQRFMSVRTQTLLAPMVTAGLFLMIFNIAIGPRRGDVMGLPFVVFLAPGITMMTVIQNAFANTTSSIMTAKVQGNIVDTLMPPLSASELVAGYLAGAVVRGMCLALGLWLGMFFILDIGLAHPFYALAFAFLGSAMLGAIGIVAAIHAQKYDQMSAITNFIITPLAFLSGSFYSIEALPDAIRQLTLWNPIFYLIDGFRFAVIDVSDGTPAVGLFVCTLSTIAISALAWALFRVGYRLKS